LREKKPEKGAVGFERKTQLDAMKIWKEAIKN